MTNAHDPAALEALADRVERATGADRELDALIWCQVGNELGYDDPPQRHRLMRPLQPRICIMGRWLGSALEKYPENIEGVAHNWRVPAFSASLDAAMMLVPEGFDYELGRYSEGVFQAQVWERGFKDNGASCFLSNSTPHALTAASLRAAALRARAALAEAEQG